MEPAPLFEDVADGPEGGAAWWLTAPDGVRLRMGHWPTAGRARGTVLLFAGRTEYVEKYGRAARDLGARGYHTVTVDWRGQGLADRLLEDPALGHVGKFHDYQHDVAAVVAAVDALDLPRPLYLIAHSMGGCIGLRALHERLDVAAVAFTAPLWGIRLSWYLRAFAWSYSSIALATGRADARAPFTAAKPYVAEMPFDGNSLTGDPGMYAYMQAQTRRYPDLTVAGPTVRWIRETLEETRTLSQMPAPDYPALTFLGTQEDIVDIGRIEDRKASWPGGELVRLPDARHEVMMEGPATRAHIFDRIDAFFRQPHRARRRSGT